MNKAKATKTATTKTATAKTATAKTATAKTATAKTATKATKTTKAKTNGKQDYQGDGIIEMVPNPTTEQLEEFFADTETAKPISDYYALINGEVTPITEIELLELNNGKFTEKTLFKMLAKGKVTCGDDVFATTAAELGSAVQLNDSLAPKKFEIDDDSDAVELDEPDGQTGSFEVGDDDDVIEGEIVTDDDDFQDISITAETSAALVKPSSPIDTLFDDDIFPDDSEWTESDETLLIEVELIIDNEIDSFTEKSAIIGAAIAEINENRLYRKTHKSFGKYVEERFHISRPQAYQLMVCGSVYNAITDGGKDRVMLPSQRAAQTVNQSVKLLLETHTTGELQNYEKQLTKFLWEITVASAPVVDGVPKISPAHLASVKEVLGRILETRTVEVDGSDIPINLLESFVDINVTAESYERMQRQKDTLIDEVKKKRERLSQPAKRKAVAPPTTETPNQAVPTVELTCSEHGSQTVEKFVFGGMRLTCGCAFIQITGKDGLFFTDIIS